MTAFLRRDLQPAKLAEHGLELSVVQDNHSLSRQVGTVRGLHFQVGAFAQHKLIRVTRGAIFDVAVDIRTGSPTFGRHVAITLSADNETQIFVPIGFAHGFCTVEPDTEVTYKVSAPYSPENDRGIFLGDPPWRIAWPVAPEAADAVGQGQAQSRARETPGYFHYAPR